MKTGALQASWTGACRAVTERLPPLAQYHLTGSGSDCYNHAVFLLCHVRVRVNVKLCKVVGSVWGGKEVPSLEQRKLLRVREVSFVPGSGVLDVEADRADAPLKDGIIVAMDQLGAGIGEYVLVAHGSRVRNLTVGPALPVKDVVVAIVDAATVDRDLFVEEAQP